ncbi:MAG TPA: MBL fold metallo-hydrolase [Bryobacteraceae bacterium]|nr:MBL fold metallo-hydrolase [Bryobacteraceae bacterium]
MKRIFLIALAGLILASALPAAKTLDMWVIDTEGGKALLLLSPDGQSMLVDTGFPGFNGRDTNRILEACQAAGVAKLDFLVTTHYDGDHVANTPSVVAKIPVDTFVDHGPVSPYDPRAQKSFQAYDALPKPKRLVVKPGDRIPFKGVEVLVLTSATQMIKGPLKGAGAANPGCALTQVKTWSGMNEDTSENAYGIGLLYTYGRFRMLDLADLTWNREKELMCPNDPIGPVDLLMVSHHGSDWSSSPALLAPIRPRVAIMNNGERKVGAASVMQDLKAMPGLQALYLLHWSANAPDDNPPDEFIANLRGNDEGKWVKVSAETNGTFTVTNARNGQSKIYKR